MKNWLINVCPILSYEIELFPLENASEFHFNRYLSTENSFQIDNLQSNQDYQLNIKVHTEAGNHLERISFRTLDDHHQTKIKGQRMVFIMICSASFLLTLIFILLILKRTGLFEKSKINRYHISNLDLFNDQRTRLKPVLYTNKHRRSHHKNIEQQNRSDSTPSGIFIHYLFLSINSFRLTEDSQGNINPYAVTSYPLNESDYCATGIPFEIIASSSSLLFRYPSINCSHSAIFLSDYS